MSDPAAKKLQIKKYPNRRYYDATRSRHVTLEEINSLIQDGYEITVTDSRTGQDITAKVLTQIILELDSPKLGVFPVPLLHRLIRANQQLVGEFVDKYFNHALAAFLDSQRNFEHSVRQAMGLHGAPIPGISDWTQLMLGSLWGRKNPPPREASPTEETVDNNGSETNHSQDQTRQMIEELRRQVSGLQEQLQQKKPRGRRRGKDDSTQRNGE